MKTRIGCGDSGCLIRLNEDGGGGGWGWKVTRKKQMQDIMSCHLGVGGGVVEVLWGGPLMIITTEDLKYYTARQIEQNQINKTIARISFSFLWFLVFLFFFFLGGRGEGVGVVEVDLISIYNLYYLIELLAYDARRYSSFT